MLSDSTIEIKEQFSDTVYEIWNYSVAADNRYLVWREDDGFTEKGFVSSLMPFLKTGIFSIQYEGNEDTLWATNYINYNIRKGGSRPRYFFPKATIAGEIYQDFEVDEKPRMANGDSIQKISLQRKQPCLSEHYWAIRTITLVLTAEGEIKNIEQFEGNCHVEYCPYYMMDLIRTVVSSGGMVPSKIEGKNVNVRCYIEIDMMNANLNKLAQHPAFTKKRIPTRR